MSLITFEDLLNPREFFNMLKYEHRANKYDKLAKKYQKQAEKEKEKQASEEAKRLEKEADRVEAETVEEEEPIEHLTGEVVNPHKYKDYTAVSNHVFDETTGRYVYTESKTISPFDNLKDVIDYPFVEDVPDLESDDIENIISYVIRDVKRLNPDTSDSLIRHTVLTILFLTDKITSYDIDEHCDRNDPDRYAEMNTISKFMTEDEYKIFSGENCYDISEYISMKELKDIVNSIDTKLNWTGNRDYVEIVESVREGYTKNKNRENVFNGLEPIDEAPILFNNAVLSTTIGADPKPKINNKILKTLNAAFKKILKDDKDFTFEITSAVDNNDIKYNLNDIGQATIKTTDTRNGYYSVFNIDLNTIVGNGYNLIVPTNFNGIIQDIYVNIEKHPNIVRKFLTTNYGFQFNGSNMLDLELKAVMGDCMPYPVIYKQYDFSDMYKYLKDLSDEDKVILTNNLVGIINLNWYNVSPGFQMPRFRFRSFTNARKFILVSDKNVRVQSSEWMSFPFSMHCKQFVNTTGFISEDSELVVDLDNNDIRIYVNKVEVNL